MSQIWNRINKVTKEIYWNIYHKKSQHAGKNAKRNKVREVLLKKEHFSQLDLIFSLGDIELKFFISNADTWQTISFCTIILFFYFSTWFLGLQIRLSIRIHFIDLVETFQTLATSEILDPLSIRRVAVSIFSTDKYTGFLRLDWSTIISENWNSSNLKHYLEYVASILGNKAT